MEFQNYSSANTSIKQIPRLHKWVVKNTDCKKVFDFGAGKHPEPIYDFLQENGIQYYPCDLRNMPQHLNIYSLLHLDECDCVLMNNVLNVIQEIDSSLNWIAKFIEKGKTLYIAVHEGNKSGIGKKTKTEGFQHNKTTKQWLNILSNHGIKARQKDDIIIID